MGIYNLQHFSVYVKKLIMKKTEEDIYKDISNILGISQERLVKSKKFTEIEEWDSLNHLNIFIKLDQLFNNKVSKISKMKKADSIKKIIKILKDEKLIK